MGKAMRMLPLLVNSNLQNKAKGMPPPLLDPSPQALEYVARKEALWHLITVV